MVRKNLSENGFSFLEFLVSLAILIVVIGIPFKIFVHEAKQTVKELGISKKTIENIPALEIIRKDIELAGFGLPWNMNGISYSEATSSGRGLYSFNPTLFNDSPGNAPRAIVGKKDTIGKQFSYLVLKGSIFGLNKASMHWTYIDKNNRLNIWPSNSLANYNNVSSGDNVIILRASDRSLEGGSLYFTISKSADSSDTNPSDYGLPWLQKSVYLIYGINSSSTGAGSLRAPFNRIDYRLYAQTNSPSDCASGTYTLARATMRQSSGAVIGHPLLHCVADFQVYFELDTNGDGVIDNCTQDLTSFSAKQIRKELKEVKVFLLVQNGVKDINYNFPYSTVLVGDNSSMCTPHSFDMTKITDYQHYRWKVLSIVAVPKNLE